MTHTLRTIVALTFALLLAGCAMPGGGITPTAVPVTSPPTTAPTITAPTAVPPTAVPTIGVAEPTFAFTPDHGQPGTQVQLNGWNFTPGSIVVMMIGIPQPVGQPLTSATVGNDGRWSATIGIPPALPSGEPLFGKNVTLVVADENRVALASAPFSFEPSAGSAVDSR